MMNAVHGGSFTREAEWCSRLRHNVGRVAHSPRSLSERSRRRERVYLKRSAFLEAPKLVSYGTHVLDGSMNALCSTFVTKRDVTQLVKCEVEKVKLRFRVDHQVAFGEHLALVGSSESLGSWKYRIIMGWTEAGWVIDLEADPGETIEYKYLIVAGDGNVVWEHGTNRVLVVPDYTSKYYQVVSHWSATSEAIDFEVMDGETDAEQKLAHGTGDLEAIGFEVMDGETDAEQKLAHGTGDLEVIDGSRSPADGASRTGKELTVEAIDSESIEETHVPEDEVTEARQVKQGGIANGSSNLRKVDRQNTTGIDNSSKPIVEGDQDSSKRWGKISIFFLLLITYGLVSLLKVSAVGNSPWTFLNGFFPLNTQTEEGS